MLCNLQTQLLQFIDIAKWLEKTETVETDLSIYANTKYNPIKTMFKHLALPETQCIIYRPDLHNLQAKRKKRKK